MEWDGRFGVGRCVCGCVDKGRPSLLIRDDQFPLVEGLGGNKPAATTLDIFQCAFDSYAATSVCVRGQHDHPGTNLAEWMQ